MEDDPQGLLNVIRMEVRKLSRLNEIEYHEVPLPDGHSENRYFDRWGNPERYQEVSLKNYKGWAVSLGKHCERIRIHNRVDPDNQINLLDAITANDINTLARFYKLDARFGRTPQMFHGLSLAAQALGEDVLAEQMHVAELFAMVVRYEYLHSVNASGSAQRARYNKQQNEKTIDAIQRELGTINESVLVPDDLDLLDVIRGQIDKFTQATAPADGRSRGIERKLPE